MNDPTSIPYTLSDLIERAPADKIAIILPEQDIRVTYAALRAQVLAVAEQLAAAGDYKGAIPLYDQALKAAPGTSYLPLRRAVILYKAGRRPEAEKLLAAERSKAKTSRDFNSLCWAKATAGIELDSALQDCQESLRLQPGNGATIDSLAFVKLRQGKVDEAITLYTQAIDKKTGSASYMGRAIAYSRKGDKAHSDADRNEALKLDPDAETRFAEYGMKL